MAVVHFHHGAGANSYPLTYVVMVTSFNGGYVFVNNKKRGSWEIPGGRIEAGESPEEAAIRETFEETGGAVKSMRLVCIYSVLQEGARSFGALYFTTVENPGIIPDSSEISEIEIRDSLPEVLSFPDIQPHLFKKVLEWRNSQI